MFGGIRMIESHHLPQPSKLELSPGVLVSPEFRAEYNAWLRARFGTKPAPVYMMSGPLGDFAVASPAMMDAIRRRVVKAEL